MSVLMSVLMSLSCRNSSCSPRNESFRPSHIKSFRRHYLMQKCSNFYDICRFEVVCKTTSFHFVNQAWILQISLESGTSIKIKISYFLSNKVHTKSAEFLYRIRNLEVFSERSWRKLVTKNSPCSSLQVSRMRPMFVIWEDPSFLQFSNLQEYNFILSLIFQSLEI
jgi:hypothetical protein